MLRRFLPLLLCVLATLPAVAQESDWEKAFDAKTDKLKAQYHDGSNPALAAQLMKMRARDQDIRKRSFEDQDMNSLPLAQRKKLAAEMNATDAALTRQLKQIVAMHGWPTIPMVGLDAAQAALLMLTHTADHAWQKRLLPELQVLVEKDEILGSDIATIVDHVLRPRASHSVSAPTLR